MMRHESPQRYTAIYDRYISGGGKVRYEEDFRIFSDSDSLNPADSSRFDFLCIMFDILIEDHVEGDFVELGVYKGHTAALLGKFAERMDRGLYLLDTFSGWDKRDLTGRDAGMPPAFGDSSIPLVEQRLRKAQVDVGRRVRFIKGRFPDTVAQLPANHRYCLAHLDCDLGAPTEAGLRYFYPRVSPGGVILIHDYLSGHFRALKEAVDRFRSTIPEDIIPVPDACGTVAIRKSKT